MSLPKIRSTSLKSFKLPSVNGNMSTNVNNINVNLDTKDNLLISQPFQINPPQVVFKDIESHKEYQLNVEIRNLSKKSQRIRFQSFKNKKFSLKYTMKPEVAPGLIVIVNIKYECQQQISERQVLKIVSSDGYVSQVQITTYPKQSKIVFDPFVNIGFTQFGKQCVKSIEFTNQGSKSGTIQLINKYSSILEITPKIIKILPKQKSFVILKYKAAQAGIFKGFIELKSTQILAKNQIQIYATSLDQARFIVNPHQIEGQNEQLYNFGTIFVGQKKILKAFIVNNSPKKMLFKTTIKKGLLATIQQFSSIQTPHQQGLQQQQKVFNIQPSYGQIQPFSQFSLNLICESVPNYRQRLYVSNYALADQTQQGSINAKKTSNQFKPQSTYQYSIWLKQDEQKQKIKGKKNLQNKQQHETSPQQKPTTSMILQLKSNIVCPQIKIDKKFLFFGDCILGQSTKMSLFIQNRNLAQGIDLQLPKIPYFDFFPSKFTLLANQSKSVQILFNPKVIGKIDSHQILLINKVFQIQLRCMGISKLNNSGSNTHSNSRQFQNRSQSQNTLGRVSVPVPLINNTSRQLQIKGHSRSKSIQKLKSSSLHSLQHQHHSHKLSAITDRKLEQLNQRSSLNTLTQSKLITNQNRQKYSKILTQRRQIRQKKQNQQKVLQKWNIFKKSKLTPNNEKFDDEGLPQDSPIDIQFQVGQNYLSHKKQKQRFVQLPISQEKLYVLKPIGDHQPPKIKPSQNSSTKLQSNPTSQKSIIQRTIMDPPKRFYPQTPVSYNHRRQCAQQLSSESLALIQVIANRINFGDVFIKSEESRYFWIKNMTRNVISCQLQFKQPQLALSYKKAQAIPSGEQAGFPITFYKNSLGWLKASGYYIINGIHKYEIQITVKCVQVQIQIDRLKVNFTYPQKQLQLSTAQQITLYNPGNSSAKFKFVPTKQKIFLPQILQGMIQAKKQLKVKIILNPPIPTKKMNQYKYQQKIQFKILDGSQSSINCTFLIEDPKYTVKCDLLNTNLHTICINNQIQDFLQLKNTSKTNSTVLHLCLTGDLSSFNISHTKIRLMPDQARKIKLKYTAKQKGERKGVFIIQPRGGQPRQFLLTFNVIEPTIIFSKQVLDLETLIVKGTPGYSKLTISHKQLIDIPLTIDLRPRKYSPGNPQQIQNITLKMLQPKNQTLDAIIPTIKSQQNQNPNVIQEQNLVGQQINVQDFQDSAGQQDQDQILQRDQLQLRNYKIILKPNVEYVFALEFQALFQKLKSHLIRLPMSIEKSLAIQKSPVIKFKAIAPKFIFQPSIIDFKKKYIGKPDRIYPKIIMISIVNLDKDDIEWELRSGEQKNGNMNKLGDIFQLQQTKGFVKKGERFQMKATFNPYAVGEYQIKLPLYIKNIRPRTQSQSQLQQSPEKMLKYNDIIMKGTSTMPQLFFNKRQVLFPVVPLNIQTTTFFRILNDGYDNCSLSYEFNDDIANIDVKVHFPQGNNIGMSKQKIKVDLTWKFDRPMSFTIILTFRDQMGKPYSIPVSGTADNSILTNYLYFLRSQKHFKINDDGPLQLVQFNQNQTHTTLQRKHSSHSLKSSATNRSLMSYLGVTPINPYILANTFQYIKKYLNQNILIIPIGQFPGSFIQNDGKSIFEILNVFSGKNYSKLPWVVTSTAHLKHQQKTKKLYLQYSELIKMLKLEGALLNHIRPEYLLSFSDLNTYLSTLSPQKSKFYMPSLMKINSGLYKYLSIQSWTTLFYQIIKINLFSRVTQKNIKSHISSIFACEQKSKQIPKSHLDQSNFISVPESILFYWAEQAYLQVLLQEKRITNLDKDFKNGLIFGSLIQRYTKNNIVSKMILHCKDQNDQKKNAQTVCDQLEQIGLLNHIQAKNIYNPLQRQMLMLLMHLYLYLPFYLPNKDPVIFQCTLGQQIIKSIELKNPTPKPLKYKAKYNGSSDFTLESQSQFTINPKSSFQFKIRFVSRFSNSVNGKITFINEKDKGSGVAITSSALAFQLRSEVTQIMSEKIWKISGGLYQNSQFFIDIFNKFTVSQTAQFSIKVSTSYKYPAKKKSNTQFLTKQQQQLFACPIILKSDIIKIKKNSTSQLGFNFIPMTMYPTKITLLFQNNMIGQFQHQIQALVQDPQLCLQIKPSIVLNSSQEQIWDYMINPKNQLLMRAKKNLQNFKQRKIKVTPKKNQKIKNSSQNQQTQETVIQNQKYFIEMQPNQHISLPLFVLLNELKDNITNIDNKLSKERDRDNKNIIKNQSKEKQKQSKASNLLLSSSQNVLKFKFSCVQPVYEFSTNFTVRNLNFTDVRKYRIIFTVLPKPLKAQIDFKSPARKQIIQPIPIVNRTDRDWNIKVTFIQQSNKNGNYFALPAGMTANFVVKRESTGELPIIFKPRWIQKAQAKLILNNPITLDQFQYILTGEGLQPLAQQHIPIKCSIKQIITRKIQVKNPYTQKPISFRVQTDIQNFKGEPRINVPQNGKALYQFSVQPLICGDYTNCITFYEIPENTNSNISVNTNISPNTNVIPNEKCEQFIWYTVQIQTNTTTSLKSLRLEGQIRKRYPQKIEIPYSQSENTSNTFKVILNGEGLIGPQSIVLKPKCSNLYEFEYFPLEIGLSKGSIYLINENIGQMLIDLELKCNRKPPINNHLVKAQLGSYEKLYASLQNPINKSIIVKVNKNTNPIQFIIIPQSQIKKSKQNSSRLSINVNADVEQITSKIKEVTTIKLLPYQTKIIEILYIPGTLDELQKATISFSSQIGDWEFSYCGIGLAPTQFQPLVIYKQLKRLQVKNLQQQSQNNSKIQSLPQQIKIQLQQPYHIRFKNPFNYSITVGVQMMFQEQNINENKNKTHIHQAFKFQVEQLKTQLINLQAQGAIQIPFIFRPEDLLQYRCKIIIKLSDKIFWSFPIIGIAQVHPNQIFHLRTKCRQTVNQHHQIKINFQTKKIQIQKQPKNSELIKKTYQYQIKLLDIPQQQEAYLQKFFLAQFQQDKNFLQNQNDSLKLQLIFKPMKPGKVTFLLSVQQNNGARWVYRVVAQGYHPNPDDIIHMESLLMKTANVSFKITNWEKKSANFRAYFSPQSANQFSVQPTQGSLSKFGSKGTSFYVSFTPVQYGKDRQGRLIIQTEDMYWSYILTGSLPKYFPPKVQSHLHISKKSK